MPRRHAPALALAATLAVALPAASQQGKGPATQLYIDVATHQFAGMPNLGGLGGFMMKRMGGDAGPKGYPESRGIPAGTGRFLDVALYNGRKPGVEAELRVPGGLGVGKSLPLLPPTADGSGRSQQGGAPGMVDGRLPDVEMRIHQYWGCGAAVRAGQPKVFTVRMKQGQVQTSGSMAPGLFVPDRDIDATPSHAVWPNRKNTKRVSDRSSLVGEHQLSGDGVPASLAFQLTQDADFMPKIALRSRGAPTDAITAEWPAVDRARAYFLTGVGMKGERDLVMWSSSEAAGAGAELLNYLATGDLEKWLRQKVLLPASATQCVVPKGIFAGASGTPGMGGMGMLTMIAYGPETHLVYPPRPADAKAPWQPEWSVRVRTKSTAFAMLGLDLGGMPADGDDETPQQRPSVKGLLKGILGS